MLLRKIDQGLRTVELFTVGFGIISATFIVSLNVFMRYVWNMPLSWAEELARYIMIWAAFIGASLCVRDNVHVQMNLLQTKLGFNAAKMLLNVVYLFAAFFCLYIGFLGAEVVEVLVQVNQVSSTMEFLPMWVVNLCVPIFGLLAAKNYIHLFVLNVTSKGERILTIPQDGEQ